MSDPCIQVAQIVANTDAEGPGRRFAVWFQGCPLRCAGCCNPEMLSFAGGQTFLTADIIARMEEARQRDAIEGITLLGGEPFAHAAGALELALAAQRSDLSVMIFSGFTLEQLRDQNSPEVAGLLDATDILVDGPYMRDLPESGRRWIGSSNQRVHFLSGRYCETDPCWRQPNTLELRLDARGLSVNGFPSRATRDFWQRPAAGRHRRP